MNTVEPEIIEYSITSKGIYIAKKLNEWGNLLRFWFNVDSQQETLIIETNSFPNRLEFVIPIEKKEEIRKHLDVFLPEEEAKTSYTDKATKWITGVLSGNKQS